MCYKDMNNTVIKAGDSIKHIDGEIEKVYECGEDGKDLGILATNPEYAKHHDIEPEFYPLSSFDLSEWVRI